MLRIATLSPIRGLERRSVDLAPENCHLVAQHDDLHPEVNVTATDGPDQLHDAAHCPVEEPGADAPRGLVWHSRGVTGCSRRRTVLKLEGVARLVVMRRR